MIDFEMDENIAFIGIGAMGFGMAGNVRKKMTSTSTLFINDVNLSACERFIDEFGGFGPVRIVPTAKEAAMRAKTLISMVPGPADVRQVYLDNVNGVIAANEDPDRLILESSTIDVQTTREVGEMIMKAGLGRYVDTPVSGGIPRAAAGTLCFMMGHPGSDKSDAIAGRIHALVSMMGDPKRLFFCGGLGTGLAAKISNNYLAGTFVVAVAEAMAIGIRSGVDKKVLFDIIQNSSGQSWVGDFLQPVPGLVPMSPSSNDYQPSFRHAMILKDLGLGVSAGHETGIEPTMALKAVEMFKRALEDPVYGESDMTSVYQIISGGQ